MNGYTFEIDPYCENCPEFDVTADKEELWTETFMMETKKYICYKVRCKHQTRCKNMKKFIERSKGETDEL